MKIVIIILFTCFMQVSASTFAQRVTLKERDASIYKILETIGQQTGYDFVFDSDLIAAAKPIDVNLKNATLEEALEICLKKQGFEYTISNKTVAVKEKGLTILDRVKKIFTAVDMSGKVTDSLGVPLPGAIVAVKGTNIRMATNASGEFKMDNVQEGVSVVISYVGYITQEITAKAGFVQVTMRPEVSALKEVAVLSTGYQTLSKERATGSFSKPDLDVFKKRTGTMDIVGRLEGLVAGLNITNSNNTEGETSQAPLIRGRSSVQLDGTPLYVVNGVMVTNINDLNPNDVSDITVLKDAAAAAIWGARAANGVIVITTNAGSKNQKLKVNYSGFVNFAGKPDFSYNRLLSSKQYIEAARETFNPSMYGYQFMSYSLFTPAELLLYNKNAAGGSITNSQKEAGLDSLSNLDNTSQIKDLLFTNAVTTNQTFGISGGGNNYTFYGSLSYTGTQSNRPGQKSNAYGLNLTQEFTPAKYLRLSLTTALKNTQSDAKRAVSIQDKFLPYQLFRDADGKNISMPFLQGWTPETRADLQARSRINLDYVPLDEINYGYTNSNAISANIVGNAWVKLMPGLNFHGSYGYTKSPTTGKNYDDHLLYRSRRELLGLTEAASTNVQPHYYLPTTLGTYTLAHIDQQNYTLRNQLEYVFSGRNGNDQLSLQVGQEANEQLARFDSNRLYGYDAKLGSYIIPEAAYATVSDPVDPEGGFFSGAIPYSESEQKSRSTSYFALGSYTLNQKYSLDASWRVDHSSLIGQDKSSQNRPIWSIGGKWQVKKEQFMQNLRWLDNLGLRATYGITGNSPLVGASSRYNVLSQQTIGFGAAPLAGNALLLSSPANRKLNWESTETINIGIDFAVFNRFSGSVDLYRKKTTDLLGQRKANPLTGYTDFLSNIGNLNNRGLELDLRSENIVSRDFSWSTGFVFAYNKNKLVDYETPTASDLTGNGRLYSTNVLGYPINSIFAYKYAGLDAVGDPQIQLADGRITKSKNVAKAEDILFMGSRDPKFTGGLTNTFRYKDFSLSVNMIYNMGGVMFKEVNDFFTGRLTIDSRGTFEGNIPALFADRWKTPGDESRTVIPAYVADSDESDSRRDVTYYTRADVNVVSASYAKIRDFTLSYSLSPRLLKSLKTQSITLSAQATNFMLWRANNVGLDPESQNLTSGTRYLPANKHTFSLGLNITF